MILEMLFYILKRKSNNSGTFVYMGKLISNSNNLKKSWISYLIDKQLCHWFIYYFSHIQFFYPIAQALHFRQVVLPFFGPSWP